VTIISNIIVVVVVVVVEKNKNHEFDLKDKI
jgi:hypothetical protein